MTGCLGGAWITHVTQPADFLEEVEATALIQAKAHGVHLAIEAVDRTLSIDGDRLTLAAAVTNLLQNAFKFTPKEGNVSLTTRTTVDRDSFEVEVEIEDECGCLPQGKAEKLFLPFEQRGDDRSGVGLGLSICRRAAQANHGELHVKDLPGKGCIFYPRHAEKSANHRPSLDVSLISPGRPKSGRGRPPSGA